MQSVPIPSGIAVRLANNGGGMQIRVDPQLLKRVLINLVTNAIQAMPGGGRLFMEAKVDSSGHVSISVEDTGVGIPDRIRSQIFTPLFTTKPRGQGFGLAVCKRVIEAHGGTIGFESVEGKGTRFTVEFPSA
jgi:signal transduction histidine kinase